jgi:SAM-dependent methyltransferase
MTVDVASALRSRPLAAARRVGGRVLRGFGAPTPPSPSLALEEYRHVASSYDSRTAFGERYRGLAVARLRPRRGEVVLDVGCGTGLNFSSIEAGIGPEGRLVGIDLSQQGWRNVSLIESAAEEAEIPARADAVLLSATHDIMRSPRALENVLRQVRRAGRVVAAGPKWAPWWAPGAPAVNTCTWYLNRPYVTTFAGFARPWSQLGRFLPDLEVEPVLFGAGYIAAGTLPRD